MAQAPHALFEAHLDVRDLDRSVAYYRHVVGLELAYRLEERNVVLLWAGGRGPSMLGLWAGSSSPNAARLHLAFVLGLEAVLAAPATLRSAGVEPLDFDGQPTGEACVIEWMPAASVFFRDPDGHLLEFIAMLPDEPRPEAGVVPWREWTARSTGEAGWRPASGVAALSGARGAGR
jgi:lactoylglutathione lyase